MFLCDKCATKQGVDPFVMLIYPRSHGPCEDCHEVKSCVDVIFPSEKETKDVGTSETTQKPTD
jgi:hypothetical protein